MTQKILALVSLFNFCDWVIAFFIAGTAAKVNVVDETGGTERRTFLAVGIMLFFTGFAVVRLADFLNQVMFLEEITAIVKQVPQRYTIQYALIGMARTICLLFFWFAVSVENRKRKGLLSGNVIRGKMIEVFEKLR